MFITEELLEFNLKRIVNKSNPIFLPANFLLNSKSMAFDPSMCSCNMTSFGKRCGYCKDYVMGGDPHVTEISLYGCSIGRERYSNSKTDSVRKRQCNDDLRRNCDYSGNDTDTTAAFESDSDNGYATDTTAAFVSESE